MFTNALIDAKSPYLLQHAHNPVNWVPWDQSAFERAKQEDKLIFLSIGYSTCHWCHVMEEECFEDEEVATLLNRDFICIKVDREERPDVDDVYMSIAQGLGSGGGWPLTVVMLPDGRPFFAGTYIPKSDRFRIRGLMTLLPALVHHARHGGEMLEESLSRAERRIDLLNEAGEGPRMQIDDEQMDQIPRRLMMSFDPVYGGFGASMKFPQPHQLLYLLRYHARSNDGQALGAVELTLDRIRHGGIYDQLGGGIHRYATDRIWKVPHFEKMLYDQAQLAMVSAECFRTTGEEKYRRMTEEIFDYVLRDLLSPEAGFYSAEDADSEGEEGKFYLWSMAELKDVLSGAQFSAVAKVFDIQGDGNWIDRSAEEQPTTNILYVTDEGKDLLEEASSDFKGHFETACRILFEKRAQRVRPHRDEKIVTDWNGLMIASLARGGRLLEEPKYVRAAAKAFDFLDTHLRDEQGRLLHRSYRGSAGVPAFLDDYAFLAWGAIELYHATYNPEYLRSAKDLIAAMDARFADEEVGGYFFTAHDAEQLLVRPKQHGDDAIPSGNSVATLVLSQLARLTGEPTYEDRADRLEEILAPTLMAMPSRATQFGVALEYRRAPTAEVVIVGNVEGTDTQRMLSLLRKHPTRESITVLLKHAGSRGEVLAEVAPFTQSYGQIDGKATAYVCRNRVCQLPTTDPGTMIEQLDELTAVAVSP